jgi:hypothetical protein
LWQNITPSEIETNETAALQVFEGIRYIAGRYAGSPSVATLLETGLSESRSQQPNCKTSWCLSKRSLLVDWDFPNVWPVRIVSR